MRKDKIRDEMIRGFLGRTPIEDESSEGKCFQKEK